MTLAQMYALADRQTYYSHTAQGDDIWNAIDKGGLRIYLWIKKELRNYFIKWDTTTIQTVIGQDEYSCPPDLATMIRFGERMPGETNYRRIQPTEPTTDLFANRQFETIVLSLDLLCSDFCYIGPYLPRNAGPQAIVCLDANGNYWQYQINDAGFVQATRLYGSALPPVTPFIVNDPGNTTSWQLVVNTLGGFSWSPVAFGGPAYPVSPFTMATMPGNLLTTISVSSAGVATISKPSQSKGPYKVRLAPTPTDLRQTELIYDAKYLPIYNQNSYNVIPEEGHQCQLDFAKAELMRQSSDDLADKYEALALQELTEFLTFIRERQTQQPATQQPYLNDLE
jgi:hypothetical protein